MMMDLILILIGDDGIDDDDGDGDGDVMVMLMVMMVDLILILVGDSVFKLLVAALSSILNLEIVLMKLKLKRLMHVTMTCHCRPLFHPQPGKAS